MRSIFVLFVFLTGFNVHAQQLINTLHLRAGLSQPVMEYAAVNLDEGGFAMSGLTTSVALSSLLNDRWGIHVQGGLQLHPVAVGRLGYEKVQEDPFLQDVTIRSEPYRIMHFAGGPVYRFKPLDYLHLDVRFLAGMFSSTSPHQLYKPIYFLVGPDFYEITSSLDYSFAYGGGIASAFRLSSCYTVAVEAELLSSKAAFRFNTANGIRTDFRQIRMLNVAVSLLIALPHLDLR